MVRVWVSSLVAISGPFDPRLQTEGWRTKSGVCVNEASDRRVRSGDVFVCGSDADVGFGEDG